MFYSGLRFTIRPAFALLLLACTGLSAQEYSFRSFGVSQGLNNLVVRRIYQDRVGFLWVSTENGIFRYDGDRFEPFGLAQGMPPNSGAAFGDAPDGSLLVGGVNGLFRLSGNRFQKVSGPFKTISWAQGIQSDGPGRTYLGTDAGLVELDAEPTGSGFSMVTLPRPQGTTASSASAILVDGDALWYGCGHELCRKDQHGTRVLGRETALPPQEVQVIQKDGVGNLWVRVRNEGVFVLAAGKSRFERPHLPFTLTGAGGVPAVDGDGRILLPSADGLVIGKNKGWQKLDRSAGLRGTVYSALEDRQHSLWIGLAGRGLAQWRGYREWANFSSESGLSSDIVYEILPRDDGSLWVATEAGLFRGQKTRFGMAFKPVPGVIGSAVHSLRMSPDKALWIGTESRGAGRIDPHTGHVTWFGEAQGLTGKAAYCLRFDRGHRLWAATEAGLFVSEPPYRSFTRIAGLPVTRFWSVAEATDGVIWAGGHDGLFEESSGGWKNYTRDNGLSNTEVLSLGAAPQGVMWAGYRYGGGIDRIHPLAAGGAIEKGVQRTGTDGLVYFLESDASGRLWAGTDHGVDIWDGAHWTHFDSNDGLAADDCNLNAFAEEPDGTVWIGTSSGLSRFKPLPQRGPTAPLAVVFTKLAMGPRDVSELFNPAFPPNANSLAVRYSALNATRQNQVSFRYRLGGATSNWTETSQRELQFANLAPGGYTLEVNARESDGPWSGHPASFPFRILTPWYLTWWFFTICILVPLSVAAATLRLRFLGAQKRERELVRVVEERTADLRRANEELSRLSFTDPLTGLANRRVFDQTLDKECSRVRRKDSALSLLMIDVDHFKALNDSAGHQRGDECLVKLGQVLSRLCRRQVDLAARCGGEEFAIVLPDTGAEFAAQLAESVRKAIQALEIPNPGSPVSPFLTVSVGVATCTRQRCWKPQVLVAAADGALYDAKRSGRNRVSIAVPDPQEFAT